MSPLLEIDEDANEMKIPRIEVRKVVMKVEVKSKVDGGKTRCNEAL